MIPNLRRFLLLFLIILPFLASCGVKPYPYEKISDKTKIQALSLFVKPFFSLSSNVRVKVSYLGKGIKGKGYLYYREGKLRILLLNPLKSPLYDLIVYPDGSYLIDYQYMGYLDLKDTECLDSDILPEKFNAVLPMLFFDFSEENLNRIHSMYQDESGRISGFDYLSGKKTMQRLVSVQYLNYQTIGSDSVPGKIVIENGGNDIIIELTGDIRVDIPIKDKVFDLTRLNKYKDLCSEK